MPVDVDLGRYRPISKLGSGGMATVDLAEDTILGRLVALKRMNGSVDVAGLSRLRREALAGASLNHPNLVSVYDILTLRDGELVIVMEYVQGDTLRELLTRRGALPRADALPVLAGVAAGLDAIHGAGIVHRDVKPSNILVSEDGAVKVADLGVASVPDRTQTTTSGSIIGSLNYMAPEQLDTAPVTSAIDIYALAAVAFEMLSGVKARESPNPVALAHAMATKPPPRLNEAWPAAPVAASDLLARAMSREPRARPAAAGEFVAELKEALAVGTESRTTHRAPRPAAMTNADGARARSRQPRAARRPPAPPFNAERRRKAPSEPPARSRRWLLPGLALGAVCIAAALGALLRQGSSPRPGNATAGASRRSHTSAARAASTRPATGSQSGSATATSSASPPAASSTTPTSSASPPAASRTTPPSSAAPPAASGTTPAGSNPGPIAGSRSPSAGSAVAPPSPSSAGSPVAAVKSFYGLAAARRYADAWALADPSFRAQLGGYSSFQAGQANDRSITFDSTHAAHQTGNSATVRITTTSVQSDGTRHCRGTVDVRRGPADHWLVHQIHITCT